MGISFFPFIMLTLAAANYIFFHIKKNSSQFRSNVELEAEWEPDGTLSIKPEFKAKHANIE